MKYLYLLPIFVAGCGSSFIVEGPDADADASCLTNIPATCPDCVTMNASDKPVCESYLTCFMSNRCGPTDPCAQGNNFCSVDTIGGGSAPQLAAIATYDCACPP